MLIIKKYHIGDGTLQQLNLNILDLHHFVVEEERNLP
jgi:hypothetical protein